MKKVLFGSVAAAAMAFASQAYADATIELEGTHTQTCDVQSFVTDVDDLDLGLAAVGTEQGLGSVNVTCNYLGVADVTYNSDSATGSGTGANLVGVTPSNVVPYHITLNSTPFELDHVSSDLAVSPGAAQTFRVVTEAAAVLSDTYSDTITVSVSPN
jgi:hypothetical protein